MEKLYTRGISSLLVIIIIAILAILGFIYFTRDEDGSGDGVINGIVEEELGRLMEDATTTDPNSLSDEEILLQEQNSMGAEPGAL